MNVDIANLRLEYAAQTLLEESSAADPFTQFEAWWQQVLETQIVEPNAMTLATASAASASPIRCAAARSSRA